MGSGSFIKFVIDIASGPLLSLIYPLFFTIQALENGAAADHGPLLRYWSMYSGLQHFDYFFSFILNFGVDLVYQQVKAKLLETNPIGFLADSPPFLNNLLKDQLGIMESLGKFLNSALQSLTSAFQGIYAREVEHPLPKSSSYDAPEDEYRSYSMRNPILTFDSNQDSQLDNGGLEFTNDHLQSNDGSARGRLKTVSLKGDYRDSKFGEPNFGGGESPKAGRRVNGDIYSG
ncbi:hypothetical protein MKX01_007375 [Papaver californicum]|nr:hypothetical protein MKX01_007375 [Papaver californicum]